MENSVGTIDILVNNAGIGGEPTIEETTETEFDRMFAVHVKGTFFATQVVVPGMKRRRYGNNGRPPLRFALLRRKGGNPRPDESLGQGTRAVEHSRQFHSTRRSADEHGDATTQHRAAAVREDLPVFHFTAMPNRGRSHTR